MTSDDAKAIVEALDSIRILIFLLLFVVGGIVGLLIHGVKRK